MNMADTGMKAKVWGIQPDGMKKAELIHAIQKAEGSSVCYGQFGAGCRYKACCFRSDCKKEC
jgi:hypothetical protein